MGRVFILGIDALSPSVIVKLSEKLQLENTRRLLREGRLYEVESTLPPSSAAAWVSIFTGMDPCQHGVFDFYDISELRRGRKRLNPHISSPLLWAKTIWFKLSRENKKTLGIGVPIFYPARKLNGLILCGELFAPKLNEKAFYPNNLYNKYIVREGLVDEYSGILSIISELSFSKAVLEANEIRELVKEYSRIDLIKMNLFTKAYNDFGGDFDLLILVSTTYDHLAHYFLDEFNLELTAKILEPYFKAIDYIIHKILNMLEKDDVLVIISDHGQHTLKHVFLVNMWLYAKGYLHLRVNKLPKPSIETRTKLLKILYRVSKALGLKEIFKKKVIEYVKKKESAMDIIDLIDLETSKAYNLSHSSFSILVRERSNMKLITRIINELNNLKVNGAPLFNKIVALNNDSCTYLNLAPDIVYSPSKHVGVIPLLYNTNYIIERSKVLVKISDHSIDSLMMVYSKGNVKLDFNPKSITDLYRIVARILGSNR